MATQLFRNAVTAFLAFDADHAELPAPKKLSAGPIGTVNVFECPKCDGKLEIMDVDDRTA